MHMGQAFLTHTANRQKLMAKEEKMGFGFVRGKTLRLKVL